MPLDNAVSAKRSRCDHNTQRSRASLSYIHNAHLLVQYLGYIGVDCWKQNERWQWGEAVAKREVSLASCVDLSHVCSPATPAHPPSIRSSAIHARDYAFRCEELGSLYEHTNSTSSIKLRVFRDPCHFWKRLYFETRQFKTKFNSSIYSNLSAI